MKNILQFFLSLLLAVGVCGMVLTVTKYVSGELSSDQSDFIEQSSAASSPTQEISSDNSSSSDSSESSYVPPSESATALTEPSNKSSLVQNGITMVTGAQVPLGGNVSDSMVGFRLTGVSYKFTNRKFVCMLVLATKTGNTTTYRYNGYESGVNYRNNARSLAYVSSATLNAHKLGMETLTESQLAILKSYVNRSVDYANGLKEATDDNSTYTYQVNAPTHDNMKVGEKFTITTIITPDVDVPVWYRSTDESVATVNDEGVVTITGKGTAVIGVYVAGQAKGVTVSIG